jgi:hypothetical protein
MLEPELPQLDRKRALARTAIIAITQDAALRDMAGTSG